MTTNNIAIVIPALNEEDALRHLLPEIPSGLAHWTIVVDNNSTDATASVASAAEAITVSEPLRGYGRTCLHGLQTAIALVIGSRVGKSSEAGAVPPQARLGNWLVCRLIRLLYGVHLHDIGSFRAMRCSTLQALQMCEMTFGWPVEMLIKAVRAHYVIMEIPIHYRRRKYGRSKVAGTLSGSIQAAYAMLRTTLHYARARKTHV